MCLHPRPASLAATVLVAPLLSAVLLVCAASAQAAALEVQVSDSSGKALAGAVVFVESAAAKAAVRPGAMVEVAQSNRQFSPMVTVVSVGTPVSFPNRDTVRHHLYSFSPTKKFEIKLYVGTPAAPVVFDAPGVAVLGCNIHDNMAAWVLVVETNHFGLTGADGKLSLPQLPAGNYTLRTWHPSLAPGAAALDQTLLVAASGTAQAAVRLAWAAP